MNKKIDVRSAIDLLKSGGTIDNVVISDLITSKVNAMDALLLAKNGYIVPDENIVYDDDQIQYDPDFDEADWGKPVPFRQIKGSLLSETAKQAVETTEFIVRLRIPSLEMKQWLTENRAQLNLVINGLVESMYKAERLPKS